MKRRGFISGGAARGFSLLELMLVIAIMGVLMGVVAWNMVGQGNKAKRKASVVSMKMIEKALQQYQLDYNGYPTTLQALVATKSLDPNIKDGWKHEFYYTAPGRNHPFELICMGEDGLPGTADDLDFWNIAQEP